MSLPTVPDRDQIPTREEVVNLILSSIAMEELGLSHVINAEGEKLQFALGTIPGVTGLDEPLTAEDLLNLNESVRKTLDSTMMNQFFLKEKLTNALTASVMNGPTGPTGPTGPASGLNAYGGIYNNAAETENGKANIATVIKMPFNTPSHSAFFAIPNSITIPEAGAYHITYEMVASFDAKTTVVIAVRSNGTNIPTTRTNTAIEAVAPVYYSGSTIVELPAGAVLDLAITSDVDVTITFNGASVRGINAFKVN